MKDMLWSNLCLYCMAECYDRMLSQNKFQVIIKHLSRNLLSCRIWTIKAIQWYSTKLWLMGSQTQTQWYYSEMLLSMVTCIEQMLYFGVKPDFDHKTFDGYLNSQLLAYASFCKKGLWSQGKTWRRVCFCLQYLLPMLEPLHFSTSKIFSRKKLQILKLKPK